MTSSFPPIPVYPLDIDSDSTLYLVYNTAETQTSEINELWADEIDIVPVDSDKNEQWADNGFANISGELFYYGDVDVDINGKINKLKKCSRNLAGEQTKNNAAGTWVRGYVVAQHHNQLVDAILRIENFVGINFSEDRATLDWRIRNLQATLSCSDDHTCPEVNFQFDILSNESDSCGEIVVSYDLSIKGVYTDFKIDFGDGTFTTTSLIGTHTYSPNSEVSPFVTVANGKCKIIQTATSREPVETTDSTFEIPLPTVPDFPTIVIPDINVPETTLTLPQIVFPCLDAGSVAFSGDILVPSLITLVPTLPSVISFGPLDIPSVITFTPVLDIPSIISFTPVLDIPSIISFASSPITVDYGDVPTIGVDFGEPPDVAIDWGSPPTVSCVVRISCPAALGSQRTNRLTDEFIDSLDTGAIEIDSTSLGIPSEIKIITPEMPDIKILHDIPNKISIESPNLPSEIKFILEKPLPSEIKITQDKNIPEFISIVGMEIPESISIDASGLPESIKLEIDHNIPSFIFIDASSIPKEIKVVGIPETIELIGNIPSEIVIKAPENLEIPLVYKGGPIPIQFDIKAFGQSDEDLPCFAITPCPKK